MTHVVKDAGFDWLRYRLVVIDKSESLDVYAKG